MKLLRWLPLLLLGCSLAIGCGEKKPDTDPKADELTLDIESGGDGDELSLEGPR